MNFRAGGSRYLGARDIEEAPVHLRKSGVERGACKCELTSRRLTEVPGRENWWHAWFQAPRHQGTIIFAAFRFLAHCLSLAIHCGIDQELHVVLSTSSACNLRRPYE